MWAQLEQNDIMEAISKRETTYTLMLYSTCPGTVGKVGNMDGLYYKLN